MHIRVFESSFGTRSLLFVALPWMILSCERLRSSPESDVYVSKIKLISALDRSLDASMLAESNLLKLVQNKLSSTKGIYLVEQEPDKGAFHLQIELGIVEGDHRQTAAPNRAVMISARIESTGKEEFVLHSDRITPLEQPLHSNRDRDRILNALNAVIENVIYQVQLTTQDESKLVLALRQTEYARLLPAIEISAARRVRRAVPELIRLLKSHDARISDRAIGALAEIQDQRAVKPLTKLADFQDTEKLAKLLDAIGTLGGGEAKSFLEFVATSHDDADIRNLAKEALERLVRRGKMKP